MESDRYNQLSESDKHQAHLAYRDLCKWMKQYSEPSYILEVARQMAHNWKLNTMQFQLMLAYYADLG